MGLPQFTLLSGSINGINAVFTTPTAYTAGTVAVYLNGQLLLNPAGNPWAETDPSTGTVTITGAECIPRTGDVISAFYIDTQDDFVGSVVSPISGTISAQTSLDAVLGAETPVASSISPTNSKSGILSTSANLSASIQSSSKLSGIIDEC